MARPVSTFLIVIIGVSLAYADIYLHNMRGSNNRLDENRRNRKNANRLFDSQNNNRGGHNAGPEENRGLMYFYAGSKLEIQWANQHSCSDQNNNCNIVIQYMCDENLRDGETTRRNSINASTCANEDCDTDPRFGHHEYLTYYEQCATRERNRGLFVANKNLGPSAQITRQNRNGQRRGYECPEERDYYPYFAHSPWKDIAILVNDESECNYYQAESQNVQSRFGCCFEDSYWDAVRGQLVDNRGILSYNRTKCEETSVVYDGTTYQAIWKEFPSHGIDAPDCKVAPWSRDNHQGNTIGGEFLAYMWTLPDINETNCALRIRYNISTNDFDYWNTDHTANTRDGPDDIWQNLGFADARAARRRGYKYKNNPKVDLFDTDGAFTLQVNLATNQFGRTFQDRSHAFGIRARPTELDGVTIHNINVRGKRGNIVQNFPTPEYDFAPTWLNISAGEYVHFQWTGSNNNPGNNAGQGKRKTDRHNVVHLGFRPYDEGDVTINQYYSLGTNYPRYINETDLWGMSTDSITKLAFSGEYINGNKPGDLLNRADPYFDFGPVLVDQAGLYHYFSTRNNAFTNRDQKGTIFVV